MEETKEEDIKIKETTKEEVSPHLKKVTKEEEYKVKEVVKKDDSIRINIGGAKSAYESASRFFSNKKVQLILTLILLALVLFSSVSIRLSGLPNLVDQTTGHYVLADPDGFYEYRVAEILVSGGSISGIDPMRDPGLNIPYTQEMLPKALALSYNIFHSVNSSITLDYIDVLYPIVAFAISLLIFFALCWYLSKSKFLALLASTILAYSTTYLGRTGAGISSHEALGLVFMFLAFLVYAVALSNFKKSWKWAASLGILTGISLALSLFSWGGGSNFVLIIFPISSLIYYLFNAEDKETKKRFIVFNFLWVLTAIVIMPIIGYAISEMTSRLLSNYGIITPFMLVFTTLDFYLEKNSHRFKIGEGKNRVWYSILGTIIIGFIGLIIIGKGPFSLISGIYEQILHPFGQGRVGLTVAYYAQPYLSDLMGQLGNGIFWVFFFGMVFLGLEFGKNISHKKHRIYFYLIWILSILGMLFSRVSATSVLNGTNFISSLIYFLSFIILAYYIIWLYSKEKFPISISSIFLFAWMIITLMSIRSAIRVMFVVVTFVFVMLAFFIVKSYEYGKKSNNNTIKYILYASTAIAIILTFNFVFGNPLTGVGGNYQAISYSASHSGPVTNYQWQNAMSWVRNNTSPDSVFVSWWDYGYLIQTLGQRTSVVDGGNYNQYWDHMVGRYLLTENNENASLSFMKSHNVSYLLIDPTDLGKYPAFSQIGSGVNKEDRYSQIPILPNDPTQTSETLSGETNVFTGAYPLDDDVVYTDENGTTFIPSQTGALIGLVISDNKSNTTISFSQPKAAFYNNGQQVTIPMRYIYYNNRIIDFGTGLDSIAMIIPGISVTGTSLGINQLGAVIYLSPKTSHTLFVDLYLLGDAFNKYPSIKLVNSQPDSLVANLNSQGANLGDFVYYQGFHGPLDIWDVTYPSYIISRPEFLSPSGEYAAFDNLTFTSN